MVVIFTAQAIFNAFLQYLNAKHMFSDEHKKDIRYTCPVELRILIQAFFSTCQTKKGNVWAVVEVCLLLIQLLIVHCGIAPRLRMELYFS